MTRARRTLRIQANPELAVTAAGDGPLLVFLHGIGGNRSNFDNQVAHFSDRWTAVAWDARGYGGSEDYEGPLKFSDFSDDLCRVLDHFGAQRACLVGVSMGGRIALDFCGRYAERVGALVLADSSGGASDAVDPDKIEAFLALRRKPLVEDGKTPADIAPDVAKSFSGPNITPDQFAHLVASLSALRAPSYLKTLECVTRYHAFPAFSSLRSPVLVMTGAHDPIAPPAMARAIAAQIPNAVYEEVPGAGHISNIENPDAFNGKVRAFLDAAWPGHNKSGNGDSP